MIPSQRYARLPYPPPPTEGCLVATRGTLGRYAGTIALRVTQEHPGQLHAPVFGLGARQAGTGWRRCVEVRRHVFISFHSLLSVTYNINRKYKQFQYIIHDT